MEALDLNPFNAGITGRQGQVCGASVAAQAIGPHADATTSANFYMYTYKVVLCQKRHSHDWGACPYAHEKEKARRRDPQTYKYSSCICPNASKGECAKGLNCPYAHTLFEYWLHPSRFRTQLCRSGADCKRALCFFAHSAEELHQPDKAMPFNSTPSSVTPSLSANAAVGTMLGGPIPQYMRFSETANGYGSGENLVPWPLTVENGSNGSFTSTCSSVTPASSSILPMFGGHAAATIISCHEPGVLFGNQLPAATSSNGASSPLLALPASDGMTAAAAAGNSAKFAVLQQLQLQQEFTMNQVKLQELELALQQQNTRAALARMQQQNGMVNMGMANMADNSIAATMGMSASQLGQMHTTPLLLPITCNTSLAGSPTLNLVNY